MWAVGHNVDIITMSFGLEEEHGGMQKAIIEAYSKNILMFAAASNEGGNRIVTYPARKEQVICIYATDGKGEPYRSNPTPIGNSYRFATLGEGVKSAWPKGLKKGAAPEQRMTGTSFATPIAAGIAACLLEFAIVHAGQFIQLLADSSGHASSIWEALGGCEEGIALHPPLEAFQRVSRTTGHSFTHERYLDTFAQLSWELFLCHIGYFAGRD